MEQIKTYTPGDAAERKATFAKMTSEATMYRSPKEDLQAKTILNVCLEIKNNEFSVTTKAMVKLLKLYRDYVPPPGVAESQQTAALKVCNKLIACISDETFSVVAKRAGQLALTLNTQRQLPAQEETIDLSDEEEVPLSTDTKFTPHRSALLDDKDGMLDALPLERRIKDLIEERKTVREWGAKADDNAATARRVVQKYSNQDRSTASAAKAQQLLLKCLSHRIKKLQTLQKSAPQTARPPITSNPWKGTPSPQKIPPPAQQDSQSQMFHSSGTPMPKPPPSGLGESHEYNEKVVNTVDVQLVSPRVPHPITASHASECMKVVSEIENMQQHTDYRIDSAITDKIARWFCPPGFSWTLTFNTLDKRRQAFKMVKESTEVMNMRIRREASSRDMAQRSMDASAKGTFPFFRYDIEREFHLLRKFRRNLFVVELGEQAAAQLEKVRRIKAASHNAGMDSTESLLFDKLMKARINAVVEAAASSPKKKTRTRNREKCRYCGKKHAGGMNACRKRKADLIQAKSSNQPSPSAAPQTAPNSPPTQTSRSP